MFPNGQACFFHFYLTKAMKDQLNISRVSVIAIL